MVRNKNLSLLRVVQEEKCNSDLLNDPTSSLVLNKSQHRFFSESSVTVEHFFYTLLFKWRRKRND